MASVDILELKSLEGQYISLICEHWKKSDIVFTDSWPGKIEKHSHIFTGWPSKLSAVTFTVGCYTVRITHSSLIRVLGRVVPWIQLFPWTQKISAKYNSTSRGVFANRFKYLCRVINGIFFNWSEEISLIISAKEKALSDGQASLFVKKRWTGSSFGADYWYELRPDGTVTGFMKHDLAQSN